LYNLEITYEAQQKWMGIQDVLVAPSRTAASLL
jgi:hypothetical protein